MPRAQKGQRFGGRQKGAKNKIPRNLVDKALAISDWLDKKKIGMKEQAEADPRWFLETFIKPLLPKNVDVNLEGEIKITWQGS